MAEATVSVISVVPTGVGGSGVPTASGPVVHDLVTPSAGVTFAVSPVSSVEAGSSIS